MLTLKHRGVIDFEAMLFALSLLAVALFVPRAAALYINGTTVAPCNSPLYCYGNILHEIQLAHPFTDSKTFVDL